MNLTIIVMMIAQRLDLPAFLEGVLTSGLGQVRTNALVNSGSSGGKCVVTESDA